MDPNATAEELRLALRRGDRHEAGFYARCLRDWLNRGGFAPVCGVAAARELIARALDPFSDVRDGVR